MATIERVCQQQRTRPVCTFLHSGPTLSVDHLVQHFHPNVPASKLKAEEDHFTSNKCKTFDSRPFENKQCGLLFSTYVWEPFFLKFKLSYFRRVTIIQYDNYHIRFMEVVSTMWLCCLFGKHIPQAFWIGKGTILSLHDFGMYFIIKCTASKYTHSSSLWSKLTDVNAYGRWWRQWHYRSKQQWLPKNID